MGESKSLLSQCDTSFEMSLLGMVKVMKKTYFYENLPFYIIDSNLFKKHNTKTINENVLVL